MKNHHIIKTIGLSAIGIFSVALIAIPTSVLVACSDHDDPKSDIYTIECEGLSIKAKDNSVPLQPKVTLNDELITEGFNYQFTSLDMNTATVDNKGYVTGVMIGETTIKIEVLVNQKSVVSTEVPIEVTKADIL